MFLLAATDGVVIAERLSSESVEVRSTVDMVAEFVGDADSHAATFCLTFGSSAVSTTMSSSAASTGS